jgi:hypothetical protein
MLPNVEGGVDALILANNFGISLEVAKRTRAMTTQREIRQMIDPSLSKQVRSNDRMLR